MRPGIHSKTTDGQGRRLAAGMLFCHSARLRRATCALASVARHRRTDRVPPVGKSRAPGTHRDVLPARTPRGAGCVLAVLLHTKLGRAGERPPDHRTMMVGSRLIRGINFPPTCRNRSRLCHSRPRSAPGLLPGSSCPINGSSAPGKEPHGFSSVSCTQSMIWRTRFARVPGAILITS